MDYYLPASDRNAWTPRSQPKMPSVTSAPVGWQQGWSPLPPTQMSPTSAGSVKSAPSVSAPPTSGRHQYRPEDFVNIATAKENPWIPVVAIPHKTPSHAPVAAPSPLAFNVLPPAIAPSPLQHPAAQMVGTSPLISPSGISPPVGPNAKGKKGPGKTIEEELAGQSLYKTELCRSYEETGTCRYGNKCQFAHGRDEVRPIVRHPKYKTEICKTFHTIGTCPYGTRCRFIHGAEEAGMPIPTSGSTPPSYYPTAAPIAANINIAPSPIAPIVSAPASLGSHHNPLAGGWSTSWPVMPAPTAAGPVAAGFGTPGAHPFASMPPAGPAAVRQATTPITAPAPKPAVTAGVFTPQKTFMPKAVAPPSGFSAPPKAVSLPVLVPPPKTAGEETSGAGTDEESSPGRDSRLPIFQVLCEESVNASGAAEADAEEEEDEDDENLRDEFRVLQFL